MPEIRYPAEVPYVDLATEPLALAQKQLSDAYMLTTVLRTFDFYQSYRRTHESRWNLHDRLYYAFVPERLWPGSSIPRASLGSHLIFEQIMGAYPLIAQALFSQPEFFSIEASFGGDPKAARAQQAHMEYSLNKACSARGSSLENEFMSGALSALLYGNGGVIVEYNSELQAPDIQWIDTRDVYVDPSASKSSIQDARSVIVRKMMSIKQLADLRSDPRMTVPSNEELYGLSFTFQTRMVDGTKQVQEGLRGNDYNPAFYANTPLPDDKQLEVLVYYSKSQITWVLNGKYVLFNEPNIYGFIPLAFMGAYPVPGRFYCMSIADVQMDNQRYIEGIFNTRLDNLTLQHFPPRFMQRGGNFMPSSQTWGPGMVIQVDDPKNTYVHNTPDVTSNVFQELGFIRQDADRATGLGGMVSGIPTPSNANRTAQGVNAQLQGSSLRLYPIINHAEYGMIIPAIGMAVKMTRMHMDRMGNLPGVIRNPDNPEQTEQVGVTPEAFMQDSKVEVKAASKMLSRDRIMQYFQTLSQSLFTSQFQAELAKNGETLDFEEILACLYDATGMNRKYKFVRKYSQEEIQAQQEQQKAQAQAQQTPQEMQLKQMDQQTRLQLGEMKKETEHEKNMVDAQKNQPNPMEMEIEKQKAELEKQMKTFELEMKQQMAQLDFAIKQMELQMKGKESEMKIQSDQQKMVNDQQVMQMKGAMEDAKNRQQMERDQQNHQMQQQMMASQHEQTIRHGEEDHKYALESTQEMGKAKVDSVKMKASAQKSSKPEPKKGA